MCHYKNTTFSCGCHTEENTLVCGYINDDLAQCMTDTESEEVSVPRVCGRQSCKNSPLHRSNPKPQDNEINHSDDEWSEESVETPEL
ncbi:hypothetical protein L873DRAFT_1660324 [Choiromyces venosus 120613-1]|uniref:Uncharacterized protein n=1 Tax=Choiromyces venosus 120613-1 TaxID=1336337 RepID=A0A3N4K686_9PEZI|nr:hypothetical protein L873DRAFT_1660324 [Choiromyces venosus 120613-1]